MARIFALSVIAVACVRFAMHAALRGDGPEYYSMLEAFWNHGTPDLRPEDVESLTKLFAAHGITYQNPLGGFFPAWDGRHYSYHFWAYPLLAVPAKALLHVVGGDEFNALAWTNAALLFATSVWLLRRPRGATNSDVSIVRVTFFALTLASHVLLYVTWSHAEIYCWCAVIVALVSLDENHPARAAFFAGLGALQAPPIGALALVAVMFAALDDDAARTRRVRLARVAKTAAAASVAGLAPLFWFAKFHVANLIVGVGLANVHLMSPGRMASLAFDLDQGLLAFVPATLLLGILGLAFALRHPRRKYALAMAVGILLMFALAAQTTNFNAGCAGLNRYDVWILPLFAWLGAHYLPRHALSRAAIALGVVAQLAIVSFDDDRDDAHAHNALAHYILQHVPGIYDPAPEIFAERTLGTSLDAPYKPIPLPIAYFGPEGATKVLLTANHLDELNEKFEVDRAWLSDVRARYAENVGPFYVEPPTGAVRKREALEVPITFGDGWYGLETLGKAHWRWMSEKSELVLAFPEDGERTLRFEGWVPDGVAGKARMTVTIDGAKVDDFMAPLAHFFRYYRVKAKSRVEIATSHVIGPGPDPRRLGYALADVQVSSPPPKSGVRFVNDGVPDESVGCAERTLEIHLEPRAFRRGVFWFGVRSAEYPMIPSHPRMFVDGAPHRSEPFLAFARHRIAFRGDTSHVVRVEAEPGHPVCVDTVHYVDAAGEPY